MRIKLAWMLGLLAAPTDCSCSQSPRHGMQSHQACPTLDRLTPASAAISGPLSWSRPGRWCGSPVTQGRVRPPSHAPAFFTLHALVHLGDATTGRESIYQAVRDLRTVYLGALVALWIAWPISTPAREEGRDAQMAVTAADRCLRKGV